MNKTIKNIIALGLTLSIGLSVIACHRPGNEWTNKAVKYIEDKYDIDPTVLGFEETTYTGYLQETYHTDVYEIRMVDGDVTFSVLIDKSRGYIYDNYIMQEAKDELRNILIDEFGRGEVNKMAINFDLLTFVDEDVCTLEDLEESDARIDVNIVTHGKSVSDWENSGIYQMSHNFTLYVSDIKDSDIPSDERLGTAGYISNNVPYFGDYILYNYSGVYKDGAWTFGEYETFESSGLTITYDISSITSFEVISSDSNSVTYHVTLNAPGVIDILTDSDSVKFWVNDDTHFAANSVSLRGQSHDENMYRVSYILEESADITITFE